MQIHDSYRAISLLADDYLCLSLERIPVLVDRTIVEFLPIEEHDEIRVLLDGARLTKVRQLRTLVVAGSLFGCSRQLRQRDDRYAQFLRERFQSTRDLADFLLT